MLTFHSGYDEIMKVSKLPEVLAKLGMPLETGAIAELLLWAFECKEEVDAKWLEFPMTGEWCVVCEICVCGAGGVACAVYCMRAELCA
jgi:hypothetical protein